MTPGRGSPPGRRTPGRPGDSGAAFRSRRWWKYGVNPNTSSKEGAMKQALPLAIALTLGLAAAGRAQQAVVPVYHAGAPVLVVGQIVDRPPVGADRVLVQVGPEQ